MPADRTRRPVPSGGRSLPLLAFALTLLVLLAEGAWIGQTPWSRTPQVLGDMGNQSIPFMAYYRDVLTGRADGDLIFAWGMSYGQSFWGTFAQYLTNPWNLVVLAFPRAMVPAAAFTAHILTGATAAAAMAALLRRMRRTHLPVALALAVAWGANPFSVLDSHYHPYWTVGSVALPLLVLSACWVRDGRGAWAVPPVVAALFAANFYTTYMACLGAGAVVLAWAVAAPAEWPRPLRTVLRWAALALLGLLGAAVVIVPTYLAVQQSAQTPDMAFRAGYLSDWLAAALPGTDSVGKAPSWTLGVVQLVLLGALLAADRGRRAVAWGSAVALVLLTFALRPTAVVWHGGDVPDGNFFRQAWVAAGIMLVASWHLLGGVATDASEAEASDREPAMPARSGAAARLRRAAPVAALVVAVVAGTVPWLSTPADRGLWWLGVVLAVGAGLAVRWAAAYRVRAAGATLLVLAVASTVVGSGQAVRRFQARAASEMVSYAFYPPLAAGVPGRLAAGRGRAPGVHVPGGHTANDPLLLGGVGATGYSTMVPLPVARQMRSLGATSEAAGRRSLWRGNDLEPVLYGVSDGRARRTRARWVSPRSASVPPGEAGWRGVVRDGLVTGVVAAVAERRGRTTTYTCPPTTPWMTLDAVGAEGTVRIAGSTSDLDVGTLPRAWQGTSWSLPRPRNGVVRYRSAGGTAPHVWCHGAVGQAGEPATLERGAHAFDVGAWPGTGRDLVVGTGWTPEWACTAGGTDARTYSRQGLLALHEPRGPVRCTFEPRGWTAGAAASGGAAVVWLLGLVAAVVVRRRAQGRRPAAIA